MPLLVTIRLGEVNIDSVRIGEINSRRIKSPLNFPRQRAIVSTRDKRSRKITTPTLSQILPDFRGRRYPVFKNIGLLEPCHILPCFFQDDLFFVQ